MNDGDFFASPGKSGPNLIFFAVLDVHRALISPQTRHVFVARLPGLQAWQPLFTSNPLFLSLKTSPATSLLSVAQLAMALTNNLRRRLNYLENTSTSNSWAKDSTTDYSGVVVSYIVKVIGMLILLCVDIGFNSSVDHDDPMPIGGSDSLRLTFGMIYFGSQVGAHVLVRPICGLKR